MPPSPTQSTDGPRCLLVREEDDDGRENCVRSLPVDEADGEEAGALARERRVKYEAEAFGSDQTPWWLDGPL